MGKIIGIDLGTTNSCVSVMEGNEPVVIPNSEGKRTTPSIVAFVENGERKIGDPAKRQAITNPTKTVYSIKRFMGETHDRVSKEIARVPYKVVKGDNNTPRVEIEDRKYSPQEISAMILQKMKKTAEDYLGQEVTEAVITVPAYFTEKQKNATRVAAQLAGLKVQKLLAEPTAAAIANGGCVPRTCTGRSLRAANAANVSPTTRTFAGAPTVAGCHAGVTSIHPTTPR